MKISKMLVILVLVIALSGAAAFFSQQFFHWGKPISPEATLSAVVTNLKNNNYVGAVNSFYPSDLNKEVILGLDPDRAIRLADSLANAQLVSETSSHRVYKSNYVDVDGKIYNREFEMIKTSNGAWIISNW